MACYTKMDDSDDNSSLDSNVASSESHIISEDPASGYRGNAVSEPRKQDAQKAAKGDNRRRHEKGAGIILEVAQNALTAASENLAHHENALSSRLGQSQQDSTADDYRCNDMTRTLASLARLYGLQRVRKAVVMLSEVTSRLAQILAGISEKDSRAQRTFSSILINTIAKESAVIDDACRTLSIAVGDKLELEESINAIRAAVLRCTQAFHPIYRRTGNRAHDYWCSLDEDWAGIQRTEDSLPAEFRLDSIKELRELLLDESCNEQDSNQMHWSCC